MTLVVQAAVLDGFLFDAPPFSQDGFTTTEVDISRGQDADALVVSTVFVVADEGSDHLPTGTGDDLAPVAGIRGCSVDRQLWAES